MNTIILLLCCVIPRPMPQTEPDIQRHNIQLQQQNDIVEAFSSFGFSVEDIKDIPKYKNQPIRLQLVYRDEIYLCELFTVEAKIRYGFQLIGTIRAKAHIYTYGWSGYGFAVVYDNVNDWDCRAMSIDRKVTKNCIGLYDAVDVLLENYRKNRR